MAPAKKIKTEKKSKMAPEGARQLTMSDMMRDSIKKELRLKSKQEPKQEEEPEDMFGSDTESNQDSSEGGHVDTAKKVETDVKAKKAGRDMPVLTAIFGPADKEVKTEAKTEQVASRNMPVFSDIFAPTSTSTGKQEFFMKKVISKAMKEAFQSMSKEGVDNTDPGKYRSVWLSRLTRVFKENMRKTMCLTRPRTGKSWLSTGITGTRRMTP